MIPAFIHVRIIDVVDILLVAALMYQVYMLIRGTIATYIFMTIITFYVVWLLVKDNMLLLGGILGQIIGVGAIAINRSFSAGTETISHHVQYPVSSQNRNIH